MLASVALLLAAGLLNAQPRRQPPPDPGRFAYYLLSLSWAPQYCWEVGMGNEEPQCDPQRHYGFVVHGLWPQNDSGPNPRSCEPASKLDPKIIRSMLDLMPSQDLLLHEWGSHGTCSGLGARQFFDLTRNAAYKFKIPARFQQIRKDQLVKVADFRKALLDSNPGLSAGNFALYCDAKALREVRVCLDKDLSFRGCSPRVHDACGLDQMLLRAPK